MRRQGQRKRASQQGVIASAAHKLTGKHTSGRVRVCGWLVARERACAAELGAGMLAVLLPASLRDVVRTCNATHGRTWTLQCLRWYFL